MSKKIYINPGHSNVDPGAVGYETERKLNVKTAEYMNKHLLANYDCQTKVTDGSVNSTAIVAAEANSWGADLLVSIHNNAGGGDGYEALVYSTKNKALGQIFEKNVKAIGQNSRGVKYRPDLGVLRRSNMPAILNEGAFVDNKTDINDWNDDTELKMLGEAYAKAAAEFLEMEKKNALPNFNPTDSNGSDDDAFAGVVSVTLNVLKKGSSGNQVKALQRMLHASGYGLGAVNPIDGDFGNMTDTVVRIYQKDNGLEADGIVGRETWNKLLGV